MNENANNAVEKQKPRRRWFRFRLRTMLVLVTLLSAHLGWAGWEMEQRRRERVATAGIEEIRGRVYYGTRDPYDPYRKNWWDKSRDRIFGKFVRSIIIDSENMNDLWPFADLKHLQAMTLLDPSLSEKQIQDFKLQHPNCDFCIIGTPKELRDERRGD